MAGPSAPMDLDVSQTEERDKEIEKILKVTEIILVEIGLTPTVQVDGAPSQIIDLDLSDAVSSFLMTVYTCLRKEQNDKAGHSKYLAYEATIATQKITVKGVIDKLKGQGIAFNFLVATPIIELMTAFKSFFDETRTGVTKFRVRDEVARRGGVKRDREGRAISQASGTDKTHNIGMYGLNNQHVPLLQGITVAPERRTGILKSLGPLTQAILLVMETKYPMKLVNALKNSIQMLPMANEITQCFKDTPTPGMCAGVMKELGDILLLTTSRSTQKIYFPLLVCYAMWQAKGNTKWSFSGSAMMKLYNSVVANGLKFRMKSGSDGPNTSEVIFHAMFGTYLDDLGVLGSITNKKVWHHRKDLNNVYMQRGSKEAIIINPIMFTHVSKMAQALQTKTLGNVDPCSTSRPSFTGTRNRVFTQEFAAYLSTGKSAASYSSDPTQLHFALKKVKDEIIKDMDNVKLLKSGTKGWEQYTTAGWVPSELVPTENGKKFYGKAD